MYFYGDCSAFERETAREYVERQAVNFDMDAHEVFFVERAEEIGGIGR